MRINTNMAALNAWRALSINSNAMAKSLEKLSSGYRVNRAADDAAGLAVSEKMRAQIRGLNMAIRNAQDGVSLIQTAEGGAQAIQDMLQRMRELAIQASNGTLDSQDKQAIQEEIDELIQEIDRTAKATKFNGIDLLTSDSNTVTIQVDATATGDNIAIALKDLTASGLGVDGIDVTSDAANAIGTLDDAIKTVSEARANFGAYQNRLESAIQTLQIQSENLTAAESRIRDADMALEMANFTKYQILQQASTAMLAHANMSIVDPEN